MSHDMTKKKNERRDIMCEFKEKHEPRPRKKEDMTLATQI